MKPIARFANAAIVTLSMLLAAAGARAAGLRVVDAWIQEGPPSVPVQAGYLVLENQSAQTIVVTAVRSPIAERVEIHRTDVTEDTATMTRIPELPLPARGKLSFGPGGYHLMVYGLKEAPRAGAKVPLEIQTAGGTVVRVDAAVRREDGEPADGTHGDDDHAHHDHHDHM